VAIKEIMPAKVIEVKPKKLYGLLARRRMALAVGVLRLVDASRGYRGRITRGVASGRSVGQGKEDTRK
jgi:hypothetical protein